MQTINVHDAKTHFSRLIDAAAAGEEIIIAKAGKPTARLLPLAPALPLRTFGTLKGQIRVSEDFDAPLPDALIAAFEGA